MHNEPERLDENDGPQPSPFSYDEAAPTPVTRYVLIALAVTVVAFLGWRWFYIPPIAECGPFPAPIQAEVDRRREVAGPAGYRVETDCTYDIRAQVMSVREFSSDRGSVLSPVDFVLAWGPLTREPWVNGIRYSQGNRWYHYKPRSRDLRDMNVVAGHSANTHILLPPDDPSLRDTILGVRRGDVVHLKGYLVSVFGPNGYRWISSRTREDTGGGSCEVFYVTDASVETP